MEQWQTWRNYHDNSLLWAFEARSKLISDCKNHDIFYFDDTSSRGEMLISVIGKSQRGKTTCILSLLGVEEDQVKTVTDILRGSRKKGNSATSTATIYKISDSDEFGLGYSQRGVAMMGEEEFRNRIDEVRDLIEREPKSVDQITIMIPRKYFHHVTEKELNYEIVDLPGIESADKNEKDHVKRIVDLYMKHSTAVILVEQASSLTDLGHHSFKERGIDIWSKRFKVILTRSYSLESLKELVIDKTESEMYLSVRKYYEKELRRSLRGRPDEFIEIYPMEFGESLLELILKYPQSKESVFGVLLRLKAELLESVKTALTREDQILESVNMTRTIHKRLEDEQTKDKALTRLLNSRLSKKIKRMHDLDSEGKIDSNSKKLKDLQSLRDQLNRFRFKNYTWKPQPNEKLIFVDKDNKYMEIEDEDGNVYSGIKRRNINVEALEMSVDRNIENLLKSVRDWYEDQIPSLAVLTPQGKRGLKKLFYQYYDQNASKHLDLQNGFHLVQEFFYKKMIFYYLHSSYESVYHEEVQKILDDLHRMLNEQKPKLLRDWKEIVQKEMQQLKLKNNQIEDERKIIARDIQKMEEEITRHQQEYQQRVQQYEDDALVVSRFHEYLQESFTEHYNQVIEEINQGHNPAMNLLYARLITEKYHYIKRKLEIKNGTRIKSGIR